jgi:5-methylcytosine-specific restriction endonuclease McrA
MQLPGKLEMQLSEAEKKALIDVPMLDFPYEQHPNNRCVYSDWKMIPVYLQRELAQAKEKESKKEKQRAIKARVAKADEKTRVLAASVKLRLPQDHLCPYCGKDLGDSPHADHIYPVSRGGLSTSVNMVYVCTDGNAKKRDKTLRMFIEEFELDRSRIEERLSELGKEFSKSSNE